MTYQGRFLRVSLHAKYQNATSLDEFKINKEHGSMITVNAGYAKNTCKT